MFFCHDRVMICEITIDHLALCYLHKIQTETIQSHPNKIHSSNKCGWVCRLSLPQPSSTPARTRDIQRHVFSFLGLQRYIRSPEIVHQCLRPWLLLSKHTTHTNIHEYPIISYNIKKYHIISFRFIPFLG